MTTNNSFVTLVIGVAFLGVATIGIVSPVHAQSSVDIVSAH
jgi:hypothetical protein